MFIDFKEFIADFIKDETGIWWLVNVKGFILESPDPLINSKFITHYRGELNYQDCYQLNKLVQHKKNIEETFYENCNKQKMCRYCEQYFSEPELE